MKAKAKAGKNRKNSNNKKANDGGGGGKRYLIRVFDFVPMAETIANNTESVLVPSAFCTLFNRAIQAQRRVAVWFEARAVQEEADSNKRHHHFITVLEDTFRLLRPFISSGSQATKIGGKRVASEALAMENKFAGLSLEDVAELADDEAIDRCNYQ